MREAVFALVRPDSGVISKKQAQKSEIRPVFDRFFASTI
jgi:hypothetical protein